MVIGGEPWKENSLFFQNVDNGKDDDGHFLFLFFCFFSFIFSACQFQKVPHWLTSLITGKVATTIYAMNV